MTPDNQRIAEIVLTAIQNMVPRSEMLGMSRAEAVRRRLDCTQEEAQHLCDQAGVHPFEVVMMRGENTMCWSLTAY